MVAAENVDFKVSFCQRPKQSPVLIHIEVHIELVPLEGHKLYGEQVRELLVLVEHSACVRAICGNRASGFFGCVKCSVVVPENVSAPVGFPWVKVDMGGSSSACR